MCFTEVFLISLVIMNGVTLLGFVSFFLDFCAGVNSVFLL